MAFVSEKHSKYILEQLNDLRQRTTLCDVVLKAGECRVHAHRAVLSAWSSYFSAMFTSEFIESRQNEIEIHDIDGMTLESLIEFCYSGRIDIEEHNALALLEAAGLFQLQDIQDKCCAVLKSHLSPSNCLEIRDFADTHSYERLQHAAEKIVFGKFEEVAKSKAFLLLPVTQLIAVIASDNLNAQEENVYNAVMGWIRHELVERRPFMAEVLNHVRLPLCKPEFVAETLSKDDLVKWDLECRALVDEAKDYLLLPPEKRREINGKRMQRRKGTLSGILFAVGGQSNNGIELSVEQMNAETGEWRLVAPMATKRHGAGVAVLNDQLFVVGGYDGNFMNSMERYDPQTNQWNSALPMPTARGYFGVTEFDGLIYAIGGDYMDVGERYDPIRDCWMSIAPMLTGRHGLSVTVMNGCLYAIGGRDKSNNYLNTVERLDPRENNWTTVTSMTTERIYCGSAVFNGCIYVAGGHNGKDLSSVECFNRRTEQWSDAAAMNSHRSGLGLAVVNEQLMAVGGSEEWVTSSGNDGSKYLKTVEIYESESNCWRLSGEMNIGREDVGLGVVYDASRR